MPTRRKPPTGDAAFIHPLGCGVRACSTCIECVFDAEHKLARDGPKGGASIARAPSSAGLYVDLLRLTQERAQVLDDLAPRLRAA